MISQQISISGSQLTETVTQALTLHMTCGGIASTIDESRGMDNAFVDDRSQPGREIGPPEASGMEMFFSNPIALGAADLIGPTETAVWKQEAGFSEW